MRLHTDFHDYYDNAVGYGIDDNVHYNRFTKEVEIYIKSSFDFPSFEGVHLLGFCGQIYPLIELEKYNREYDHRSDAEDFELLERYFVYSFEEFQEKEREWEDFYGNFGSGDHWSRLKLKQFFIDWKTPNDKIFLEYKVPSFVIDLEKNENKAIINPKLKDYGFDRIKDSFTAFQEISMYLSNILVEQKEVAKVADKLRIEKHGFDLKKSFRKEKKS